MLNDNALKYYNASELWSGDASPEQKLLLDKVLSMLPADIESILDVGCGNGVITNQLPNDKHVCGLDISDEALKHVDRDTKVGSIDKLPFDDDAFDLLLSTDTIEHLSIDIYRNGLNEMQRVARKYIMIAVPYMEDLELAKAKCSECGCEYHINWHLRSLDIKKIVDEIGTKKFSLCSVGFSGDSWPFYCDAVDKVDRIANNNFHIWDRAVCPLCSSSETVKQGIEAIEGLDKLRKECFNENLRMNSNHMPTRNEMLLLFKAKNCHGGWNDGFDKDKLFFYIKTDKRESEKIDIKARLMHKGCYDIAIGSNYNSRLDTKKFSIHPYIIDNENINWGNIQRIDDKLARCYIKKSELPNHAVFIIPEFTKEGFNIIISYKDCSEVPLTLQVYDKNDSYIRLGDLECKNDSMWKTSVFSVPPNIDCLDEGYIFDLVCYNEEIEPTYYIDKILIDGSYILENTLNELCDKEFADGMYKFYELELNEAMLRDTIIHVEGMNDVKEFGLLFDNIAINLDKYKIDDGLFETHIYKWVFNDPYFNEAINASKIYNNDMKSKVYKLFQSNFDYNLLKEVFNKGLIGNRVLASSINDKSKIIIDLLHELRNKELEEKEKMQSELQSMIKMLNDLNRINSNYEIISKEYRDRIIALNEELRLSRVKTKDLKDKIAELDLRMSDFIYQIKEKDSDIKRMKETIEKLNNRKLYDFIFKKGEQE